jgi:PAS domain S-box-containing protein
MTNLRDLAHLSAPVSSGTKGAEVFERFEAEPDLMAVAIVDDEGRPVGLVDRSNFTLRMGSIYGRALYAGRAVSLIMDDDPLIVDEDATVAEFAGHAIAQRPSALLQGFIVISGGRYLGVGSAISLLQAVTEESRRHADELSQFMSVLSEAKADAQSAHDLLREALDAMSEGVAIFDHEDRCVIWNAKYAGYHRESADILAEGLPFETLLRHGVERGQYVEALGQENTWLSNRLSRRAALDSNHFEEQRLPGERYIRLEDTRLATGGSISVAVDVTDIKRREASFRLLFENNPVPLAVFDRETLRFLAVNEAAAIRYQYSRDEFLKLSVPDILSEEDRAIAAEGLFKGGDFAYSASRTWTHVTATGERLSVLPYTRPLTYHDQPAILTAAIDITGQRQAEKAMKVALDQAETANNAKGEFLANMSHEIRTPLNGVVGVASVLAQSGLTPKQSELVGIIETSAKTLQAILADVLDIAKIDSGRFDLQEVIVHPAELITHVATLFSAPSAEKGLRFEVDIDEGAHQPVWADGTRLAQIVTNLCSNAVKFTEEGLVSLAVRTTDLGDHRRLSLTVSDTGIGMSKEARTRLFERFSQADGSITRRFGGTGLGLSISQELANMMGGEIRVASVEGAGSTFTLDLTFQAATIEPENNAQATLDEDRRLPISERRLRVLLVEDHPVNRKVVELMIGELVDLHMVENGAEGVEAVLANDYDLILMDMQMPVMDGLTATRAIRGHERENQKRRTPIVILTANALPEHIEASHAAGADTHLAKPISTEALLNAMDTVLAERDPAQHTVEIALAS